MSEVAAVAQGVAGAHVAQRLLGREQVMPGRQVQAGQRVVDRGRVALRHPAERGDHVLEPGEVHHDEVIDVDPGVLLDRLDGAGHAERGVVTVEVPDRERLVDLELVRPRQLPVAHLAGRDVHPGIARDRHDLGPLPVRRDVDDHRGVGLVGDQPGPEAAALPVTGVGAEDEDVLRLRVGIDGLTAQQPGLLEVVLLDVAVEVLQQHEAADGDHGQQGGHASGDGQDDNPFPLGHASPH
jgi:hypothetical protein